MDSKGCARRARGEAYTSVDVRVSKTLKVPFCSAAYIMYPHSDDAPGLVGPVSLAALAALMRSIGLKPSDVKVDPILLACATSHNFIDPSLPHE